MDDKRTQKRFRLNVSEVNGTVMSAGDVNVIDVSVNGIALESTKRLNIGSSYGLRLADKKMTISLKGNVVWSCLIESRNAPTGHVIPVYKVGMNFIGMTPGKGIEFLNFILENQRRCVHKAPAVESESGPEMPKELSHKTEQKHNCRGSIGYHKAPGITEHPDDKRIKEPCQAATTGDVSLTKLIVPGTIVATPGEAVPLNARAVATSKAGEVLVTVTLKAVSVAGVKVGIHPANITKELDSPTNFSFSSRIVCIKSGTWPIKWTAKIISGKGSNTVNDVLTGTTRVVCR